MARTGRDRATPVRGYERDYQLIPGGSGIWHRAMVPGAFMYLPLGAYPLISDVKNRLSEVWIAWNASMAAS
jgi:hypothetical protein